MAVGSCDSRAAEAEAGGPCSESDLSDRWQNAEQVGEARAVAVKPAGRFLLRCTIAQPVWGAPDY